MTARNSLPQRTSIGASSSFPVTSAEKTGTHPFAPAASTGPRQSDGAVREQAVNLPHRLANTRISAPTFADYFDEYARMTVGIVGLGTLALGLLLWAGA